MPYLTSRIQFGSVFPKKAWIIVCKTDPDPIWMAWSGFGQMRLVLKRAGMQESSGLVSGRMQPAWYQFLTFRLSSVLPQTTQNPLYKTSPDPIGFWLSMSGFAQTDPVQKPACEQESSGQRFWANPDVMRIRSGIFTGFALLGMVSGAADKLSLQVYQSSLKKSGGSG